MKETIRAARQKSNAKAPLYAKIPASRGRFAAHAADLPTSILKNRRLLPTLSRRANEGTQRPAQDKSRTSCFPASPRETADSLPTLSRRAGEETQRPAQDKSRTSRFPASPRETADSSRRSRGAQAKKHSVRRGTKTAPRVFQHRPEKPPTPPDALAARRRKNTALAQDKNRTSRFPTSHRETAGFLPALSQRCRRKERSAGAGQKPHLVFSSFTP